MTAAPSEDDVRAKAYELWQAGGMTHGRDKEDWVRAKEILAASAPAHPETAAPSSIAQTMVEGMLGAAHLAASAAASAVSGLFGSTPTAPVDAPKTEGSGSKAVPDAALEAAERKLRVEDEARVQGAKTEAAGQVASQEDASKARVNPDG